ncbi:hypothetical protein BDP27DRAFT_1452418 [Rhodocollybia butyracea]|uniref:Uncharacterized protein n=1 Tax=Rhodocollybia butyracea TaxID=206335 RepID=A0A9P5PEB4_9AGAR|nr:hypothetical protein BDP27DRAFT_1452418 [Rhodocollybia butyracea]
MLPLEVNSILLGNSSLLTILICLHYELMVFLRICHTIIFLRVRKSAEQVLLCLCPLPRWCLEEEALEVSDKDSESDSELDGPSGPPEGELDDSPSELESELEESEGNRCIGLIGHGGSFVIIEIVTSGLISELPCGASPLHVTYAVFDACAPLAHILS